MRHRYMDLFGNPDGRVDGQKFINMGGQVLPANMETLRRVRDNPLPNRPHAFLQDRDIMNMPNSRKPGA